MKLGVPYLGTLIAFLGIDFVWLGLVMPEFYRTNIGHLMAEQVNFFAAGIFYLLFIAGLFIFAVLPSIRAGRIQRAATLGALLGLIAYGTYDLSNMATLTDWPLVVTVADMIWGTFLGAVTSVIGYSLVRKYNKKKIEPSVI